MPSDKQIEENDSLWTNPYENLSEFYGEWIDRLYELITKGHFMLQKLEAFGLTELDTPWMSRFQVEIESFLLKFHVAAGMHTSGLVKDPPVVEIEKVDPEAPQIAKKLKNILDTITS